MLAHPAPKRRAIHPEFTRDQRAVSVEEGQGRVQFDPSGAPAPARLYRFANILRQKFLANMLRATAKNGLFNDIQQLSDVPHELIDHQPVQRFDGKSGYGPVIFRVEAGQRHLQQKGKALPPATARSSSRSH